MVSIASETAAVVLILVLALGFLLGCSAHIVQRQLRRGRYLRERGW
jgi:hypothetical protein